MDIGYWVKKLRRITRYGQYSKIRIEFDKITVGGDTWYEVTVWGEHDSILYVDALGEHEIELLVKAVEKLFNVVKTSTRLNGFSVYAKGYREN